MVQQLNAKDVKEKILKFLEDNGPNLPVQVAKHMNMNSIFASAFLSEMASDGMIKISDMKVGGSPLYYPNSKIALLENFMSALGNKEREACLLLKENGILEDSTQHPAIRVALRGLKDFAFPFKKDEKIFWRYFLFTEEQVRQRLEKPMPKVEETKNIILDVSPKIEENKEINQKIEEKAQDIIVKQEEKNSELDNINKELEQKKKELEELKIQLSSQKEIKPDLDKKLSKKLKSGKKVKIEDEFLNEIKPILEKKGIEIINLDSFDKKQIFAKTKKDGQEYLLAAYNKKKIEDEDLIRAYRRALSQNLPYFILSRGEVSKKTKEAIEAYKKLNSMEKLE
jgi:hypothetical protein